MRRFELVAAMVLLGAVTAARATDVPIMGLKLIVVDKTFAAGKAKAVFVAKDPGITKGTGTDPTQIEATLDVAYDGVSGAFMMPQGANWLVNSASVGKYVNKTAPTGGAVKVSVIKPTSLVKVVGKSLGDTPLDISSAPNGPVYVVDTIVNGAEETRLCTQFAGCAWKFIAGGTGYKLVCKGNSTGDPACTAGIAGGLIGCADGQREGFVDAAARPDIAGCSGGWDQPGTLNPVSTGCGAAGDDSGNPTGAGCGAADLCADGWHVCATPAEVAANSADGCASATQAGDPALFFVQRQSGLGSAGCATTGANDLFGCGNMGAVPNGTCTPLTRFSNDGCVDLPTGGWFCGGIPSTTEALDVVKTGADGGGVLCCRGTLATTTTTSTSTSTSTSSSTTTSTSSTTTTTICVPTSGTFCDNLFGQPVVYDTATGFTWEKKTTSVGSGANPVDLHDVDNRYTWAGRCSVTTSKYCQPNAAAEAACKAQTDPAYWATDGCEQCTGGDGTCDVDPNGIGVITTAWNWLAQVNAANYAFHDDWRLPYAWELPAILLSPYPCGTNPCIDSIFGPTASNFYWTASTFHPFPPDPWAVNFFNGDASTFGRDYDFYVRAVRGPS